MQKPLSQTGSCTGGKEILKKKKKKINFDKTEIQPIDLNIWVTDKFIETDNHTVVT